MSRCPRSPRSSHNGPVPSYTPTAPTLAARADQALAGLSPGYFALVMGTGIVSIGLRMAGVELAALLLLVLAMLVSMLASGIMYAAAADEGEDADSLQSKLDSLEEEKSAVQERIAELTAQANDVQATRDALQQEIDLTK